MSKCDIIVYVVQETTHSAESGCDKRRFTETNSYTRPQTSGEVTEFISCQVVSKQHYLQGTFALLGLIVLTKKTREEKERHMMMFVSQIETRDVTNLRFMPQQCFVMIISVQ